MSSGFCSVLGIGIVGTTVVGNIADRNIILVAFVEVLHCMGANVPAMHSKGIRRENLSDCTEPKRCILFLIYSFLKPKSSIWRTCYENQFFNLAMNPLLCIAIVVCWLLFFFSFSYSLSYSSASFINSSPQPFDNDTS